MFATKKLVANKFLSPLSKMGFATKDHFYQIMQLDETRTDLM